MQKYLITGFSGFVGRNFLEFLNGSKIRASVLGFDVAEPAFEYKKYEYLNIRFVKADLKERDRLGKLLYDCRPDYILHLASYSSVTGSWKYPGQAFHSSVNNFVNLLEDVRMIGLKCRILSVGSSEEYGTVKMSDLPLREDQSVNPASPFGIARFSQELLAKLYSDVYGLDIVMTRSFNHIGPGQKESFAIPSFASQLCEMSRTKGNEFVVTGDVNIVRDFIDVRDVVHAYYLLFQKGRKGEIYNVCSGYGISLLNIIQMMCEILKLQITIKEDIKLIRPKDNPVIIGCNDKIRFETGWKNEISLEESLRDIIRFHLMQSGYSEIVKSRSGKRSAKKVTAGH